MSLKSTYTTYLNAINARDWPLVAEFVQPQVIHNDRAMTNVEYAEMIATSLEPCPGLVFVPETIVCDDDSGTLACRIRFDKSGDIAWEGPQYSCEHVFYKYENGKIARVWSMVEEHKK